MPYSPVGMPRDVLALQNHWLPEERQGELGGCGRRGFDNQEILVCLTLSTSEHCLCRMDSIV